MGDCISIFYFTIVLSCSDPYAVSINYFAYYALLDHERICDQGRWSGLSIPLTDIIFEDHKVLYDGNLWHLTPFKFDSNHPECVASNREIKDLQPGGSSLEGVH